MSDFAEAFLLVFAQLAVGGLLALSIPPFHQLERGFFKSSAAVYLSAALVAVSGWVYLLVTRDLSVSPRGMRVMELSVWLLFITVFAIYLWSLWGDRYQLRARSYVAGLLLGAASLAVSAWRYAPSSLLPFLLYPLDFVASAGVLGAAATGMLLGHWYLIDLGLTLTPLRNIHRFFLASIHAEVLILSVSVAFLWLWNGPGTIAALERLWREHSTLLVLRILLGPAAAYGLAWMIKRTLDVPQTMAATGLFYIALLAVVVGEILGRTILFRTALPL